MRNKVFIQIFGLFVGLSACASRPTNVRVANERAQNREMIESGWTRVDDVGAPPVTGITDLVLVSVNGDEIPELIVGHIAQIGDVVLHAKKTFGAHLGQRDAEYLIAHQNEIPKAWRSYTLVFPGTVWRDPRTDRYASAIRWNGEEWIFCFAWFSYDWKSDYRLVRPSK